MEGVRSIENEIQGNLNILETIANNSSIRTMVWDEQLPILHDEFARLRKEKGYLDLGVVSPDGLVRYTDGSEAYLADKEHIKNAFNGQSCVSDVIVSRVDNSEVLMYAAPIYKMNDSIGGVLVAQLSGDALNEITGEMGYGQEGYAFIIGDNGTIFSHPDRELVMDQINIFSEIENNGSLKNLGLAIQEIGLGNQGVTNCQLGDSNFFIGLGVFSGNGWTLGIVASERELLEPLGVLRQVIWVVSITLFYWV